MTILDNIKNVYFVGIGGIGMSALARYFKLKGYNVAGYDRTQTPLTEKMAREEGIAVNYADDENEIAEIYRNAENTLVVYTPAIPRDNRQLNFFTDRGMKPHKRSEVLGLLSHAGKALCIAGTHGKTTTSTLLAWLLHNSHVKCSAFLGGISENFGSNLLVDTSSDYIVIEADEFDRSFLTLNPEKAVITSMDADHMDIYGNRDSIIAAFEDFACRVVPKGGLFIKKGLEIRKRRVDGFYSLNDKADFYADNLRLLEAAGAELCYFSPMDDGHLPKGIQGLLLGGGYPELYAKELSENLSMRQDIRQAVAQGMPILAECGGFMYLHKTLETKEGERYKMVGVVDGDCHYTGHLVRFGYVGITEKETNFLSEADQIRGHEFHYYDSSDNGRDCIAKKPVGGRSWECVHENQKQFLGFAHLYLSLIHI